MKPSQKASFDTVWNRRQARCAARQMDKFNPGLRDLSSHVPARSLSAATLHMTV